MSKKKNTFENAAWDHYFRVRVSQVILGKNTKFLCLLHWKFPEFFKTHPTFICSSILKASSSIKSKSPFFLGHPVHSLEISVVNYLCYICGCDLVRLSPLLLNFGLRYT